MEKPVVFVLHGVADRDQDELVCMFFSSEKDRDEFRKNLPGKYAEFSLEGVSYDIFDVID